MANHRDVRNFAGRIRRDICADQEKAFAIPAVHLFQTRHGFARDEVRQRNRAALRRDFELVQGRQVSILRREAQANFKFFIAVIRAIGAQDCASGHQLHQRSDSRDVGAIPARGCAVDRDFPIDAWQGPCVIMDTTQGVASTGRGRFRRPCADRSSSQRGPLIGSVCPVVGRPLAAPVPR